MQFNMITTDEGKCVIVVINDQGEPSLVTDSHPNFLRISQALFRGEDASEFLDATISLEKVIVNLSSRISLVNDVLHFDGDPVYNGLATTIQRYHAEGREATNLVRLMERLALNPSANSREQLFNWTQAQSMTIDTDGFIIGYKGVSTRDNDQDYLDDEGNPLFPLDKYPYLSSGSGHGIVDGIEINGRLPMGEGVTVEMPRNEVNDNPNEGCSTGLHVGDYTYAKGYAHAGALLEVRFDPADVVSVPRDCGFAKLRCCRYTGVAVHSLEKGDDLSDYEPDAAWDKVEALDDFSAVIPQGFLQSVLNRLRRGGKDKV